MKKQKKETEVERTSCNDVDCPIHGSLKTRGRTFKGYVIKKFPKRIVIEFERTIYIRKYERYAKKKTRVHARLPKCKENEVNIGDYVLVQECRPLSKIIHFVFTAKIADFRGDQKSDEKKISDIQKIQGEKNPENQRFSGSLNSKENLRFRNLRISDSQTPEGDLR